MSCFRTLVTAAAMVLLVACVMQPITYDEKAQRVAQEAIAAFATEPVRALIGAGTNADTRARFAALIEDGGFGGDGERVGRALVLDEITELGVAIDAYRPIE